MADEPEKTSAARIPICEHGIALDGYESRVIKTLGYEVAGMFSTGEDGFDVAEDVKAGHIPMDFLLEERSRWHACWGAV
jgi:hypothetical protein